MNELTLEEKQQHIEFLNWNPDNNPNIREEFIKLAKEFMIKNYDLLEKLAK